MQPWHEDDSFWAIWAPDMFSEKAHLRVAAEVEGILALARPAEGASILDLCCGPGRITLPLARLGYRMTGVDRTDAYLATLNGLAEAEGLEVETVREDMRRFRREDAFDAALNLFTSFGYFEDQEDDREVARNLFASLRPSGTLVMELMGKEILARIFSPRNWTPMADGAIKLRETEVTRNWTWVRSRWILLRGNERTEHVLEHRIYSAAELIALLEDVGFVNCESFGSLGGAPYDHEAKRLVVLARKPAQ
ncbi:MAG: class I SAM-dependent methyltransferase [Armatimonadota bacterium]